MAKKINVNKIPKKLQSILWSADVEKLDLVKDKNYIIHQVFAYGSLNDISWLFQTYPKRVIVETFTQSPYKDYRAPRFHFVKDHILKLENLKMDDKRYVKNIPRDIR